MEVITIYFSYIKKTIFCLFDYKTCSGRREHRNIFKPNSLKFEMLIVWVFKNNQNFLFLSL